MERFSEFLEKVTNLFCERCSKKGPQQHHMKNMIHQFLNPKIRIDDSFYKNYFDDVEHGFFHGMCAAYNSYILNNYKLDPRLIISLLLHDFLKCNNYTQEEHDKLLQKFFCDLLPETYIHSDPKEPDQNKILIKSDRLELMRYPDWKTWVDNRLYNILNDISIDKQNTINIFYTQIRPALEYFYKNKQNIFIRHGFEKTHFYKKNTEFYPDINSFQKLTVKQAYPIEIDSLPLTTCSDHGKIMLWYCIQGFITHNDFINGNGRYITQDRDHMYAISKIPLNNWIFTYQNINQYKDCQKIIDNLRSLSVRVIPKSIIKPFFNIHQLFQNRLTILNKQTTVVE